MNRMRGVLAAVGVLLAALLVGFGLAALLSVGHKQREADLRIDQLTVGLSQSQVDVEVLRRQLQQHGVTPVVAAPSGLPVPLASTPIVYIPVPGRDGRDGKNGLTPKVSAGRDGRDSTVPGPPGSPGAGGRDSTVPGPEGPAGPTGPPGPSGSTAPDPCPTYYDDPVHPGYQMCARPSPTPSSSSTP